MAPASSVEDFINNHLEFVYIRDVEDKDCPICKQPYTHLGADIPHRISNIPGCSHVFGIECLAEWLAEANTCPLCRTELFPREEVEDTAEALIQRIEDLVMEEYASGGIEALRGMTGQLREWRRETEAERPEATRNEDGLIPRGFEFDDDYEEVDEEEERYWESEQRSGEDNEDELVSDPSIAQIGPTTADHGMIEPHRATEQNPESEPSSLDRPCNESDPRVQQARRTEHSSATNTEEGPRSRYINDEAGVDSSRRSNTSPSSHGHRSRPSSGSIIRGSLNRRRERPDLQHRPNNRAKRSSMRRSRSSGENVGLLESEKNH